MMRFVLLLLSFLTFATAFNTIAVPSGRRGVPVGPSSAYTTTTAFQLGVVVGQGDHDAAAIEEDGCVDRRRAWQMAVMTTLTGSSALMTLSSTPPLAWALETAALKKVVVAGATGQTGRRILERLVQQQQQQQGLQVVGGVRNVDKALKALSESSTVVRGAMVQNVAAVAASSAVDLQRLDVEQESVEQLADTLRGADALIIAVGFVPGNILKMNAAAHAVDNLGTIKLIDAAQQSGTIKKVVLVSSILTNGRAWGQEKSPGFVVTNAFGGVLDEKLTAELHLRASGLDYTIVRPGGLKAKPPTGTLVISAEDTLNAGEVSRDLVADVCVAALTDGKASNKVLEIVEDEGVPFKVFNGLNM